MPSRTKCAVLLGFLMAATDVASASSNGYISLPWTPTTCIQETHFLSDPCTGGLTLLRESATLDLDPFACTSVVVDGPNIGVECVIIQPSSVAPAPPSCANQFAMWVTGDAASGIDWYRVPCATSYDAIRGTLSAVTQGASQIDLGPVTCLAEDLPQDRTFSITGPTDAEAPPVGSVYFYLVRSVSTAVPETYGSSSDNRERLPSSGDCSF